LGGGFNAQFLTSGGNNLAGTYLSFQYVPGQASWSGGNSTIGNTTPIPLTDLGLSAGASVTCLVDMKVESGTGVGGFYAMFWDGTTNVGSTGTIYPPSETAYWSTYAFPVTIPAGVTGMSFGVQAPDYSTGTTADFDNIRVAAGTVPLNVQITSPTNGATSYTTLTISASAFVQPASVANVNFYNGATLLGNVTNAPYNLTVTGVPTGPAALTAVAQDSDGNFATSSVVNVTITTPTASAQITSPTDGATVFTSFNIHASASVTAGSITNVEFYNGATLLGNVTNSPYVFAVTGATPGSAALTVVAYDDTGTTATSSVVNVTITTPIPSAQIISPAHGATVFTNFNIYASASVGAGSITKVEFYDGATLLGNVASAPYVFAVTGATPGSAALTAVAYDDSGTTATSSVVNVTIGTTSSQSDALINVQFLDDSVNLAYGGGSPNPLPAMIGSAKVGGSVADTWNEVTASLLAYSSYPNGLGTANPIPLNYADGSASGVSMTVSTPGGTYCANAYNWGNSSPFTTAGSPYSALMQTMMYAQSGQSGTITLTGLAVGQAYDLYVYTAGDHGTKNGGFTVNGVTQNYVWGGNTTNLISGVSYLKFVALLPDNTGTLVVNVGNASTETDLNGFQLLPSPGPTMSASLSGGNINLSFLTQLGHSYTVQYKDNLTDVSWSTLSVTDGTGADVVVPDSTGNGQRFYRLSVQ
jgi:hypothetical protein